MKIEIVNVVEKVIITGLNEVMIEKQITNETLSAVAGVAYSSVNNARLGRIVTKINADAMIEAINSKVFKYNKRGPKGPRT